MLLSQKPFSFLHIAMKNEFLNRIFITECFINGACMQTLVETLRGGSIQWITLSGTTVQDDTTDKSWEEDLAYLLNERTVYVNLSLTKGLENVRKRLLQKASEHKGSLIDLDLSETVLSQEELDKIKDLKIEVTYDDDMQDD